jgi:hypothetical protein
MQLKVLPSFVIGDERTTFRTRLSNISHSAFSCPQSLTSSTARCSYLISLFNPNNYGPVKVSFRIESTVSEEFQVVTMSESRYNQGIVQAGRYKDFMIKPET